jgi:hypothetical protein
MLNGGTLEHAQQVAASVATNDQLYDRTKDEISLDEVLTNQILK